MRRYAFVMCALLVSTSVYAQQKPEAAIADELTPIQGLLCGARDQAESLLQKLLIDGEVDADELAAVNDGKDIASQCRIGNFLVTGIRSITEPRRAKDGRFYVVREFDSVARMHVRPDRLLIATKLPAGTHVYGLAEVTDEVT